jgi:hypothetical protein
MVNHCHTLQQFCKINLTFEGFVFCSFLFTGYNELNS